jgi:hypothetical protein
MSTITVIAPAKGPAPAKAPAPVKTSVKASAENPVKWKKGSTPLDRLKNESKTTPVIENFDIANLLPLLEGFNHINSKIHDSIEKKDTKVYAKVNNRNLAMQEYYSKNADLMSVLEIVSFLCTIRGFYKKVDKNGCLTNDMDMNFSGIIRQMPGGAMFDDHNSAKIIAHLKDEKFCKDFNSLFQEIIAKKDRVDPDLKALILMINFSLNTGCDGTVINILSKLCKQKTGIFANKNSWDIVPELKKMSEEERNSHLELLLKPFEDKMYYFSFIIF